MRERFHLNWSTGLTKETQVSHICGPASKTPHPPTDSSTLLN